MTAQLHTGRINQKERTRAAIVEAARELMTAGAEVSMPLVAATALVSEATAYRYFPDLASLITEAVTRVWPSASKALAPLAGTDDPVERIAFATETMLRDVHTFHSAVRSMIAASITHPDTVAIRPGRRFGLIDEALAPLATGLNPADADRLEQLKRDLAIVVSAEAFFTLTDLCHLTPDDAIASAVRTARTVTAAAVATMTPTRSPDAREAPTASAASGPHKAATVSKTPNAPSDSRHTPVS